MKSVPAIALALSLVVSTSALATEISLVGTWVGERDRVAKVEGRRGGLATLVSDEQQGRTFKGHLTKR